MPSALLVVVAAVFAAVLAHAQKPDDLPCVTWVLFNDTQDINNPQNYFAAATNVFISEYSASDCANTGNVYPCFNINTSTWGHHDFLAGEFPNDYCRTNVDGVVTYGNEQYLPRLGPKWQTWKWHNVSTGDPVPANAIRFGSAVMARNNLAVPGQCMGMGFTGWAEGLPNGTFGLVHFSVFEVPFTTDSFEVAICEAYHPTPQPPTPAPPTPNPPTPVPPTPVPPTPKPPTPRPPTPKPPTPVPPTPVPTTPVPTTPKPTPPPTPSPTLPPNNKPYIRFANTVPSPYSVTATITQGSTSYTWTSYAFAQFSDWVEVFAQGVGTITLTDSATGAQLLSTLIPLTNGPLVVAVKDYWPPSQASNVETIAASYVPAQSGSGVRLFNLSPDTPTASMSSGGTTLATAIDYTLGSTWAYVPVQSATFTVTNAATAAVIATDTFLPPPAPFVFTNFLVGLSNTTNSAYTTRLVPLVDAPEQ